MMTPQGTLMTEQYFASNLQRATKQFKQYQGVPCRRKN